MKHKQILYSGIILFMLALVVLIAPDTYTTNAQDELCPTIVTSAIETTNLLCDTLGQNQACYGNIQVEASAYADFGPLTFSQPGDLESLLHIQSLQLSPMDTEANIWGMARMEVLANLPAQDLQTVTLLLFGDTEVENAVQPTTPVEIAVSVNTYVNVRQLPTTNAAVVGTLAPNDIVQAVARLGDNSWVRVQLPGGGVGWLFANLINTDVDLSALRVDEFASPYFEPMQAFYLSTDMSGSAPACSNAPASGLLIQTPEGMGEITFLVNEVTVDIGSTVFMQSTPGGFLSISTVEGAAQVTANGVTYTAWAGTTVTVPMTEDNTPAGAPNAPVPYDMALWLNLPLTGLNVLVSVNEPLTVEAIQALIAASIITVTNNGCCPMDDNSNNGNNGNGNGNNSNSGNNSNNGNGNGNGDNCPGNSCGGGDGGGDDPTPEPTQDPNQTVVICHRPPGNPNNAQTLTVTWSEWLAHSANHPGDTLGACP